jgi:hypothetical protein
VVGKAVAAKQAATYLKFLPCMKQTLFFEIEMALRNRPKSFRLLVIAGLHLCFLVLLQFAVDCWQDRSGNDYTELTKPAKSPTIITESVADNQREE